MALEKLDLPKMILGSVPTGNPLHIVENYFHTIRHLRPIQVYGYVWSKIHKPHPSLSSAPQLRVATGTWTAPAEREPSMTGPSSLDLLNRRRELPSTGGWNDSSGDRLWLYNLHYFDDLNARCSEHRTHWHMAFMQRWIEENPPGSGIGWEPYPLSVRIVNWIKWVLAGNTLPDIAVHSLAVQVRYLAVSLEYRLMGNHLLANAKALVFAGIFFRDNEATRWLEKGLRILENELSEQILDDGGHFERSPMYHSIVLEDLLDLYNIAHAYPDSLPSRWAPLLQRWSDSIQKMRVWLKAMCHPDGQIGFFNDAAFGGAPSPLELENYSQRLGLECVPNPMPGLTHLRSSGYVRLERGPAVVLLDVGEIGPDYLLGHAHADTLTFELSIFGERLIVNTGTSTYSEGQERLQQRSTAAHNTVEIDGQPSSEIWGAFRVARRARIIELEIAEKNESELRVRCAHDGYRRLTNPVIHRRKWRLFNDMLQIKDDLVGNFSNAVARFHFHPHVVPIKRASCSSGNVELDSREYKLTCSIRGAEYSMEKSLFHPRFGVPVQNLCLNAVFKDKRVLSLFSWGR